MKYLCTLLLLAPWVVAQEVPKEPTPKPAVPKKADADEVDVQKTAERIVTNANKVGERLKDKDTGKDTRQLQQDILQDIDALLRKAQQPPLPAQMPDMNPMMPPPMKSDMPMNMGGMGNPPPNPMKNMGGMGMPMPMGMGMPMPMNMGMGMSNPGNNPEPRPQGAGRRPKRDRQPDADPKPMPMASGMMPEPKVMGMDQPTPAKLDPKDGPGAKKDPMGDGDQFGKGPPKRKDERQFADLYKDVWGHMPDRLRQEMDLYYRDQFMPRYSELLRQYYAAIAEQKKKGDGDR